MPVQIGLNQDGEDADSLHPRRWRCWAGNQTLIVPYLSAFCQWQGWHSPCYGSVNCKNDLETVAFKVKNATQYCFNILKHKAQLHRAKHEARLNPVGQSFLPHFPVDCGRRNRSCYSITRKACLTPAERFKSITVLGCLFCNRLQRNTHTATFV